MRDNVYKYLKFIRFKDIGNWSVRHLLGMNIGFNKEYQMTPIGNLIKRNVKSIDIKDDTIYKQITLKTNGGGAILRDEKVGKQIGTKKQFVVSAGQFIMSKIDARNGAFGVIDSSLDGAIVTADFPVFDVVKDKIIPQYLALLSSTKPFIQFAQSCSRGTTNRQRIDVGLFLSKKIPLPTIKQQQTLVDSYNDKLFKATKLDLNITKEEKDIEDYLLSELGIQPQGYQITESELPMASEPQVEYVVNRKQNTDLTDTYIWGNEIKKEYKYLKFVRFKDIKRWDVLYYTQNGILQGKYENVTMRECIDFFMKSPDGKSLRIETKKYPEESFQYIGMEDIEKNTGVLLEENIVKGDSIKSQTVKVPKNYFLYGKLRPYLNKYWYNDTDKNNIVCSSEFFVFSIKPTINPLYIKYYLSSAIVQQQISNAFRGARMPRINEDTFFDIEVQLPPIDLQNTIVEHIKKQKTQIKDLKHKTETLRKEALEEFEKEIFEQL